MAQCHRRAEPAGGVDNLEEPAHLEYLSPASPTSTVLVITDKNRAQFVAEGAEHVAVGPFTVDHSLTLLSRVCGRQRLDREPGEARELVTLCQGRPSTVSAVGTQLRSAPELTLAALLRKLTAEAAPPEPRTIEMIAKRAVVASLDESSQELYRRLRHHPGGGFPTELATALSGDSDAESGLRSLETKQLISPDGPGWWRLVDHTPDETGAHADEIRAIMDWHLRVAQLADVAILGPHRLRVLPLEDDPPPNAPLLETVGQALDWLDTDVANLVALAQYAADQGWDHRVVMVQQSLWALYLHRRHPGYWDITARLAIQAAQRIGDPVIESRMRAERGRYLHEKNLRTGRFDGALDELEQARRLAVEALDGTETNDRLGRRLEASATEMAGRIHYTQQRYDDALTAFRFAGQVNRELGLPRAEALMRQFIAGVYQATGRLQDALSLMLKAREVFLLLDAERDEARLLIELADLWGRLGDVEQALLTFNTAAKRLFDCQMFLHLAKAMELRGDLCHEHGFAAEAQEAWQQALRIHNEQNNGAGADAKRLAEKLAN